VLGGPLQTDRPARAHEAIEATAEPPSSPADSAGDASTASASVALISRGTPQLGFRFTNA
jgi:hypothetical protein